MSSDPKTQANIDYWTSQRELCLSVAKTVEDSDSQPSYEVRRIIKEYRIAASKWRRACTYAVSEDPISRSMVMQEAEGAAKMQGRAEAKLCEHDGDDAPLSAPTALPIPESLGHVSVIVGIEEARKRLGPLVSRVQYGESRVVITRNGKPVAMLVQVPPDEPAT